MRKIAVSIGLIIGIVSSPIIAVQVPTITLGQAQSCNIGWDQSATSLAEAQSLRYDVSLNGLPPTTASNAVCTGASNPYLCKIPLPAKTVGTHTVTIQSYLSDGTPGGISANFTYKITGNPPVAPANLRLIVN